MSITEQAAAEAKDQGCGANILITDNIPGRMRTEWQAVHCLYSQSVSTIGGAVKRSII